MRTFGRFAPKLLESRYGSELWQRYRGGTLGDSVPLIGRFEEPTDRVDVGSVMGETDDARAEEAARRLRLQTAG